MIPDHKSPRLAKQRQDVLAVMLDNHWRTFAEIQHEILTCNDRLHSEASISARLRDFRKARYGSYTVNRRKRRGNLYEYEVLLPKPREAVQIGMFEEASV